MIDAAVAGSLLSALGHALVAFVWQGAAIGAATAIALTLCRRQPPSIRYAIGCAALALMALAPIITFARAFELPPGGASTVATGEHVTIQGAATAVPMTSLAASNSWIEPYLPAISFLWAAGVLTGGLHLFVGWWRIRRMLHSSVIVSPTGWPPSIRAIADRLGVTGRVRIYSSALAGVPAVIGWLRPVILVPASALAGLPAPYLDAVLAHELAHLRRRDYLVNALQCALEVLLFYHPAVWWVSQQVRREREHCCDDEAALVCGDADVYVRALVSLEELRSSNARVAVAANGGRLLGRVRRLVEPSFSGGLSLSGGMIMALTLSLLVFLGGLHVGANAAPAPSPAVQQAVPQAAPAPQPAKITAVVTRLPGPAQVTAVVTQLPTPATSAASSKIDRDQPEANPQVVQAPAAGGIDGRVIDTDGGVVPGVTVVIRRSGEREVTRSLVTNALGAFRADGLVPGSYDLALTIAGFRTATGTVSVAAARRAPVRFRLEVGTLVESVTVAGAAPPAPPPPAPGPSAQLVELQRELSVLQARGYSPQHPDVLQLSEQIEALKRKAAGPQVPVRVGGDIREPARLRDVKPVYPPDALAAGIQGTVFIEAVLAKDGTVQSARVVQGVTELDDAALTAVRQWLYRPTMLNGRPVEIVMTVTITFVAR